MHRNVTGLSGFDLDGGSGKLNSKFRTGSGFFLGRGTDNTYGPDKEEEESFFHARSVLLMANAKEKDSVPPMDHNEVNGADLVAGCAGLG